jgi:hypothetical protein
MGMPFSGQVRRVALAVVMGYCAPAAAVDIVFGGDFENGHPIQWVRHHAASANGVSIALWGIVTATKFSGAGNTSVTLYLQVPPQYNLNADYPRWSALKTFGAAGATPPAIGDCVMIEGTISQFKGATELSAATWTPADLPAIYCGSMPVTAQTVSVHDVATDTDSITSGNQPGASTEAMESVLLRLNSPAVLTASGGSFTAGDNAAGAEYLNVSGFFYSMFPTPGTGLTSVTGVFDEFDSVSDVVYQLIPRNAADIVP